MLIFIWFVYICRLAYDLLWPEIEGADYALMFFLAGVLIPSLAVMAHGRWDQRLVARVSLLLSFPGCGATLLGTSLGLFGEYDLTESAGRLGVAALNPIAIGHLAVSTVFCAGAVWRDAIAPTKIALLAVVGIALFTLGSTGSKGPALAMCVCVLLWSARRISKRWPIPLLTGIALALLLVQGEVALLTRVSALSEDLSTLERLVLWRDSLVQIADAPVIGSAFVELRSGFYPHNVLLEAALAMGVPLATLFTVILGSAALKAFRSLRNSEEDLLGMLFLQALCGAMVSGSMYGASMLWVTLALLIRHRKHVEPVYAARGSNVVAA